MSAPSFALSARNRLLSLIYSDHQPWLQGWLRRKVGCSARAADLSQDAFVRLLGVQALESLQEPRAFLTTTALRLLIDGERRRKLEQLYLAELALAHEDLASTGPQVMHEALVLLESVFALLEGLAEKPRRAFLLNRLDGLTHAEIAEQLGVSTSMIKQYIAQVLLHFYQTLFVDEEQP
ncbi:sigma-70 family RNA polymerase sigma factor [Pseudomonas sp. LP_7_YM]|uniref:sigma-70 family RNA polymerase sigma factor n=1 Tax=Pseudomonas sp. LP_7_YM TaxID=2485137 RepID=UPI0010620D51|nr:sigma-70 family RNA polymerase sigma factor [Pseudomonas sp. LP_7_YM]TDV70287.1 RNA polymerase sigma-70 factor (ECF subfamily) [Pseudomonas sp. LP_7_YM]